MSIKLLFSAYQTSQLSPYARKDFHLPYRKGFEQLGEASQYGMRK